MRVLRGLVGSASPGAPVASSRRSGGARGPRGVWSSGPRAPTLYWSSGSRSRVWLQRLHRRVDVRVCVKDSLSVQHLRPPERGVYPSSDSDFPREQSGRLRCAGCRPLAGLLFESRGGPRFVRCRIAGTLTRMPHDVHMKEAMRCGRWACGSARVEGGEPAAWCSAPPFVRLGGLEQPGEDPGAVWSSPASTCLNKRTFPERCFDSASGSAQHDRRGRGSCLRRNDGGGLVQTIPCGTHSGIGG